MRYPYNISFLTTQVSCDPEETGYETIFKNIKNLHNIWFSIKNDGDLYAPLGTLLYRI